MSQTSSTPSEFWQRVDQSDDCWLWTGGTSGGRAVYAPRGRHRFARRAAWEFSFGPLSDSEIVSTTCGRPLCVRPDHLRSMNRKRVGTQPIPATKRCRDCGEVKAEADFQRKAQKVDGLESYCRSCSAARQRISNLRKYGIAQADYDALLERQGGVCASCGSAPTKGKGLRLVVDHDHTTGRVRGLLCLSCNCAIGHAEDDPRRLRAMADYLERVSERLGSRDGER